MGCFKHFSPQNILCNGAQAFSQDDLEKKKKLDGKIISVMLWWMDGSDDEDAGTAKREEHVADQQQSRVELNDRDDAVTTNTIHDSNAVSDGDDDDGPLKALQVSEVCLR